jgi:hypothetical protein
MPRESLRGVVRGTVHRLRGLIPGPLKRRVHRRAIRLLTFYAHRFGQEAFIIEQQAKLLMPLPRRNWLLGGYAYWRRGITDQSSQSPAAPDDF